MLIKTELKSLLDRYAVRPNRLLGQNFLVDKNMQEKILKSCDLAKGDIVFEIGPGLGALTFDIADKVRRVFAVEKDKRLYDILNEFSGRYKNLKMMNGDIRNFDLRKIAGRRKLKVIGNLPYYITTPIISHLIEARRVIESIYITVQKEVARRMTAAPGSKDFGALSLYTQFYTEPQFMFVVSRGVFYPEPDVDSAFLKLDVLKRPKVKVRNEAFFFEITRTAFSKRRKTILNALTGKNTLDLDKGSLEDILKDIGIDSMRRPEDLTLQDFANISNSIC
jgi:16S rRNA (adenine1518-N6/adenine1519-N6)-dimethyltransferase